MLIPSLNNMLDKGESKYTLIMVTSKRARQLVDGAEPLVKTNSNKPVTIALEELIEGKLEYEHTVTSSIK